MEKVNKKILLVEDDPHFGAILRDYLTINDFEVTLAKNGIEGSKKFLNNEFDLCILDVMMPYKDGITLAKEIKNHSEEMPVIFLTAKTMKEDLLKGYKAGADDYLIKPFDSEIMLLKIKAILQRKTESEIDSKQFEFNIGNFYLDSREHNLVYKNDAPLKLSPRENDLLRLLVLHENKTLTRQLALKRIWKKQNYFNARSMDVYITKLRKHLERDKRIRILNIRGEGFKLLISQNSK